MARKPYTVTVVNPAKKKRGKKRRSKKRSSKKRSSKKNSSKKKATKTVAKRRRRRRRPTKKNPTRRRRRTSRRNPTRRRALAKGRQLSWKSGFDGIIPMTLGQLWVAWVVKRWGDPPVAPMSETTGAAWTFKNYFFALVASYVGGEIVTRFASEDAGKKFYRGGVQMVATKLVWSEIVHRSAWGAAQFGRGSMGDDMAVLAQSANEGDVIDDGDGNRWILQGSKWVSMQGMGAVLQEAGYLGDELVEANYLDSLGTLVEAGPLGHQMPPEATTTREARQAQFLQRGSPDPYHSLFL